MPFGASASLVSTDLDNIIRGYNQANSDVAQTGSVGEVTVKSKTINANDIGATGGFHVKAAGTITGAAGAKTMRLKFGGSTIQSIFDVVAGTVLDWFFDAWCFNTATNAQRWFVRLSSADSLIGKFDYATSAVDTTSNQALIVTAQLANAGDTITATIFDVQIVQIQ